MDIIQQIGTNTHNQLPFQWHVLVSVRVTYIPIGLHSVASCSVMRLVLRFLLPSIPFCSSQCCVRVNNFQPLARLPVENLLQYLTSNSPVGFTLNHGQK